MTSSRRNVSHLYADPDGILRVTNDTLTGAVFVDLLDPLNMAHLNGPTLPSQYDQMGNVNEGTLVDGLVHPDGQPLHSRHIVASDRRCC